ncbi:MAG: hypothetical protein AAF399_09750 [Bacteroidota bacterium]
MIWILYLLCVVLIFHDVLLLLGLFRLHPHHKQTFGIVISFAMIAMALTSMIFQSWGMLTLSYAVYRLLIMLDIIVPAIRNHQAPSPLLPVNLFVVTGGFLAYFFEWWMLFVGSYVIFWTMSFLVAKKARG